MEAEGSSETLIATYQIIKSKLRGFSPLANHTDRVTAACRRSLCQLLQTCVAWSAQRIPTAVNLGFLHGSRYFSIQVAPQVYSRG
jgi:hypothetical protein